MENSVQSVAKWGVRLLCLLCFLFLLFDENSLTVLGAAQQVCLPAVSGQLTTPPEQAGTVLINEVLLSSKKPWSCPGSTSVPDLNNTSWLELFNPLSLSFNLYIVHASIDGGPGTHKMYFPFGSMIAAHGFLTIFPDNSTIFPNNAPETFTRRLFFDSSIIDQVTIPANLAEGQSYARIPDGASKWKITNTPTIGSSNVLPVATPTTKRTPKSSTTKLKSTRVSTSVKTGSTTAATTTSSIDTTITGEGNSSPVTSGVQPAWAQLQLPGTPSSTSTSTQTTSPAVSPVDTTASPTPANSNSLDVLRNVLFAGLVPGLIGILFWWRRRRFLRS